MILSLSNSDIYQEIFMKFAEYEVDIKRI